MESLTAPQIWIMAGAVFLIIELFTTTFFAMFMGVGAFVTALLVWMGVLESSTAQLLIFALVSGISLLFFRKKIRIALKNDTVGYNEYVGQKVKVIDAILPENDGKVLFRGAEWLAYSKSGLVFAVGDTAVIEGIDGIKVVLK